MNFCLLPFDASQELDGNCSEKLVQMNFFILGGFFWVDFPAVSLFSGAEKGVITKGVFSLEKSLESLNSLESLEMVRIAFGFHRLGVL